MNDAKENSSQKRQRLELEQADINEANPYADLLKLKPMNMGADSIPDPKRRQISPRAEIDPTLDPNEAFYAANESMLKGLVTPKPPPRPSQQATDDPNARIPGITVSQILKDIAQDAQRQDDISLYKNLIERLKGIKPFKASEKKAPINPNDYFGPYSPQMLKDFPTGRIDTKKNNKKILKSRQNPPEPSKFNPFDKPATEYVMIDPHIPRMEWNQDSRVSDNFDEEENRKKLYGDYGQDPEKDQMRDILRARMLRRSGVGKSVVVKQKSLAESIIRMDTSKGAGKIKPAKK
jgi:hypothetical protein